MAAHGLRGFASLMVLGAHIIGGTARHVYDHDAAYVEAVKHPWFFGTFGVELFFAISGFVILPSALKYSPSQFALRRFLRIYPLFFVLSLLFVVLNHFTNAYPSINNLKSIVSGFLFIDLFTGTKQLTPNAWSLSFEVMFYILTCAVVYASVKSRSTFWTVVTVAAFLAFAVAFPITLYFFIGLGTWLLVSRKEFGLLATRICEVLGFVLMVVLASRNHFEYTWADLADPVVLPLMASTALYFCFAVSPKSFTSVVMDNAFARYVGTVSYSLYLVHPYIYFVIRALFVRLGLFGPDPAASMPLFAVAVVSVSFAVTHIVHITLERWPYQRVFHQRIYRGKMGEPAPSGGAAVPVKVA